MAKFYEVCGNYYGKTDKDGNELGKDGTGLTYIIDNNKGKYRSIFLPNNLFQRFFIKMSEADEYSPDYLIL
jgi:hypothetical protein